MVKGPGFAPLVKIATHWRVAPDTARTILTAGGVKTVVRRGRPYYAWRDVWRLEGACSVPEQLWDAFYQPLLDRAAIQARYSISERTARRYLAADPAAIRLTDRIVRIRAANLEDAESAS